MRARMRDARSNPPQRDEGASTSSSDSAAKSSPPPSRPPEPRHTIHLLTVPHGQERVVVGGLILEAAAPAMVHMDSQVLDSIAKALHEGHVTTSTSN